MGYPDIEIDASASVVFGLCARRIEDRLHLIHRPVLKG
jgi:hypothetical protein